MFCNFFILMEKAYFLKNSIIALCLTNSLSQLLKLYFTYGREVFKQAFPDGVTNTSVEQLMSANEESNA